MQGLQLIWNLYVHLKLFSVTVVYHHKKAQGTSSKFSDLRLTMFVNAGDFPKLKGKANELRHFAGPLMEACVAFLDDIVQQHRHMKLLLAMAIKMESILDTDAAVYQLTPSQSTEFREAAYAFANLNTALGQHYHPLHVLLFNHTIKFHYALHLGHCAELIHPRLAWCYTGEDFMQKVKGITQSSHLGTAPHKVAHTIMVKYVQGLGLKFQPRWRL